MIVNKTKLHITVSFGPAVPSSTPGAYRNSAVVVTDHTGKPQPPEYITPDHAEFDALVDTGGGGNVVVTDYDLDGKVLNTQTQEFTQEGIILGYKPAMTINITATKPAPVPAGTVRGPATTGIYATPAGIPAPGEPVHGFHQGANTPVTNTQGAAPSQVSVPGQVPVPGQLPAAIHPGSVVAPAPVPAPGPAAPPAPHA